MQAAPLQKNLSHQTLQKAMAFMAAGKTAEAERLCRSIIEQQPDFHPAHFQLGLLALRVRKPRIAAGLISEAARIAPRNPSYHQALCEIYRRLKVLDKAIAHGEAAIRLSPRSAESFYNLGLALADANRPDEAVEAYKRALDINPAYGMAANNLGAVLERRGDKDGAALAYRKATEINPRHAEAQNNLGAILSEQGHLEEARACFNAALESQPAFIPAHYNLSSLKKYAEDDPHLKTLEGLAKGAARMPVDARTRFWFAVGKAREDTGRFDEAFDAYRRGNALKRRTIRYDVAQIEANAARVMTDYDEAFAGKESAGFSDETPIFIVGMPRSGTTLIEQILSSHSQVAGGGELKDLHDIVREKLKPGREPYTKWLLNAGDADLAAVGGEYIKRMRAVDSKALRITDKMPGNFLYAGLIHKILPRAKIIYSVRDPLDTCFSNYGRLFNDTMPFAYDLGELGRYSNVCARIMSHWRKVLPTGTILEARYEDIVADLETQARRLISFVGLPWEEGCLAFHENKRLVKTASIAQVREPIYKSSVARWKKFEKHLEPLKVILEEGVKT